MTALARMLRDFVVQLPPGTRYALVGGLAVSARTEPRFTRDIDLAVAAAGDAEAESVVRAVHARGFTVISSLEQVAAGRLATVRLRRASRGPIVDLLFASCGIELEIVAAAEPLDVLGSRIPVATVGHLIAMKLLSRDDTRRPRDAQDLASLAEEADAGAWGQAAEAVSLVAQRGFARSRDLGAALAALRAATRRSPA